MNTNVLCTLIEGAESLYNSGDNAGARIMLDMVKLYIETLKEAIA